MLLRDTTIKEKAIEIRNAAKHSIGSNMPAKSLELKRNSAYSELTSEIDEIECFIKIHYGRNPLSNSFHPGINYRMGAMIIAEIGDSTVLVPLTRYLPMQDFLPLLTNQVSLTAVILMEKRGSRYLRYALFNATRKFVCIWDNQFSAYLAKEAFRRQHYNVAISHAAKKLVRVIYQLEVRQLCQSSIKFNFHISF